MANIELIEQVMTFIKDHPQKHNQKVWYRPSLLSKKPDADPECGTAACFAGWTCILGQENMEVLDSGPIFMLRGGGVSPHNHVKSKAIELLDLSSQDATILFDAHNSIESLELMVKDIANGVALEDRWVYDHDADQFARQEEEVNG